MMNPAMAFMVRIVIVAAKLIYVSVKKARTTTEKV